MVAWVQSLLLRLSLHRRIMVFVSGILLAVFIAFGYVGWTAVSQTVADQLGERRATAEVVARHLDDLIAHAHMHMAVAAADLTALGDLDPERSAQSLQLSLHQLQYFFSYMLLFDPQLDLVSSAPSTSRVDITPEVRDILAAALGPEYPKISNLVRLPVEGSYGVLFVAPVVRDGKTLGVLAAEMAIPHPAISSIATALKLGQTGHMEIIDRKGWVLASTYPEDIIDQTEHPDFYLPLAMNRRSGVGSALHYAWHDDPARFGEDLWHAMAFVSLANANWGVGLGQTESETFAAANDLRNRAIAVAIIALIAALFFTWVGTQSVVRPIGALTQSGERMATGDLSEPICVAQADEVGRLGQVLEVMRRRLEQSLGEITSWNHELEQRVRDRTTELEVSNRHLQALMAVAMTASGRVERGELLNRALRELVETLVARAGWISLWDGKEQRLQLAGGYGLPDPLRAALTSTGNPNAPCIGSLQSNIVTRHAVSDCLVLPEQVARMMADSACCCTPIRIGSEPLGTLCLAISAERRLSVDEVALVQGIARQVAVAFENNRLSEEAALLEAQRHLALLRAEFLATVSHELRTPLGFIKGYATTLLREDVVWNVTQRSEFLHIIDEECDRLAELVESLLDAARAQAGRLTLVRQPLVLENVLRRSIERMAAMLKNHDVTIDVRASPTVQADESRLEQVIVNLLQNAAKYSPKGRSIAVRMAIAGDEASVSVLDEGIGVPTTEIARIFEPFYRVSSGAGPGMNGGAGLGLAISKAIVEAHGGRIWAEPRQDRGTAIHFTLPCHVNHSREKVDGQEVRTGN